MGKNFKNLHFGKLDEMEQAILFRAQRNSYLFLVFALLFWSLYESWKVFTYHTSLNIIPCFLLGMAALIQTLSQLILQRRAVQGDEDSFETGPLLRLILWTCAIAGIAATIAAAIILMGAKV